MKGGRKAGMPVKRQEHLALHVDEMQRIAFNQLHPQMNPKIQRQMQLKGIACNCILMTTNRFSRRNRQ